MSAAPRNEDGTTKTSAAHAAIFGGIGEIKTEEEMRPVYAAARKLAEARSPGYPWIRRLTAIHDADLGLIDAATQAAQLVAAAKEGDMKDCRTAYGLFMARTRSLGVMETLKLPPSVLPSGVWSYNFAGMIEDFVEEELEKLSPELQEEGNKLLVALKRAHYENGRACMERYFETGSGHPYDACAHMYSMLCNNLAIIYTNDGRYQDSIDLHQRGIAASPFAEHYHGIFVVRQRTKDYAGIVEASEQLWHFAAEYGYSRHDPNYYIITAVRALNMLDRRHEVPIWLERLVSWQREEGLDENHLPSDALDARLNCILFMLQSDDAWALWKSLESQARASTNVSVLTSVGDIMQHFDHREEATAFFERALAANRESDSFDKVLEENITRTFARWREEAEAAQRPSKSAKKWWEVWK
jgi:tetratricopeptide (TPR) repeat protein